MTSAGARGETARQMAATLHLPDDPGRPHAGLRVAVARINGEGLPQPRPDTLVTANALWLQAGEAFLPDFLETVKTRYAAGLFQLDFAADPEAARKTINAWVEKQTRDKIRDLIGPEVLSRDDLGRAHQRHLLQGGLAVALPREPDPQGRDLPRARRAAT